MNLDTIFRQYDFNLAYAKTLVSDLTQDQITMVPARGFENHPAFTLGHLVSGSAMLAEDLGGTFEMKVNWAELFIRKGPGDPRLPDNDKSKYPSKDELILELELQHNKVKMLLMAKNEIEFRKQIKWRFEHSMPTLIDLVVFMCITHESMHLGQLAAWRRAMGFNSALAQL